MQALSIIIKVRIWGTNYSKDSKMNLNFRKQRSESRINKKIHGADLKFVKAFHEPLMLCKYITKKCLRTPNHKLSW